MARSGLAAPQWDVGQGGLGLQGSRARIVFEELARVRAPASSNPIGIGLVGPVLMRHGTDQQKELLARIAVARRHLVPALQRAGLRVGPGQSGHPGGSPR